MSHEAWRAIVTTACQNTTVAFLSTESVETQGAYWSRIEPLHGSGCRTPIVGKVLDARTFASEYGIIGTPTHLIVDRQGMVTRSWVGAVIGRQAESEFRTALK
jgi:hypothetical protein